MTRLGGYAYPMPLKRALRPLVRRVRYLGLTPRDTILASYPRSGSTWLRFMLAEALTGQSVEWDDVNRTIPYAGDHRAAPRLLPEGGRLIKTHDPDAGPCRRAALLVRDPRDVVVSEYRWWVRGGYDRDLGTFLRSFLSGEISIFGFWGDNTRYWLDSSLAGRGDLHVARFEDLRADPDGTLRAMLEFFRVDVAGSAVAAAVAANTIERSREKEERASTTDVRQHATGGRFVGEGAVEAWRAKLAPEQIRAVEDRTADLLVRLEYPPAG
jgi:hypothetical protein